MSARSSARLRRPGRGALPSGPARIPRLALACALFTLAGCHRGWIEPAVPFARAAVWPPDPDERALRALPLPARTDVQLGNTGLQTRLHASYRGTLVLDGTGLRSTPAPDTRLAEEPDLRIVLDSVALELAAPAPEGWTVVARSRAHALRARSDAGGRVPIAPSFLLAGVGAVDLSRPSNLSLPGVRPRDLVGRWPVVIHELILQDPATEEQTRFFVIVHGTRAGFGALLHPKPWWP